MTTFTVNEKTKEGKALVKYLKNLERLSIVKFKQNDDRVLPTMDEIVAESKKARKKIAKKYNENV